MSEVKDDDLQKQYDKLFPDNSAKAMAFDEIARHYFFRNFGTMQKADFEVLLFSIYLNQILDQTEEDMQTYSDYILAKYLGIPQSKVSTLKVKKELKYPYSKFDWKKSFARICENARYESGKIKINIPDRNLYLEIKNAIESAGGYVDARLDSHLLQVTPQYFIDLVLAISEESDREELRKSLKEQLVKKNVDVEYFEKQSVGDLLKGGAVDISTSVISDIISSCIPGVGPIIGNLLKNIVEVLKSENS